MRAGDVVSDRFLVERLAGAGGMGSVFRATDRATGRPVALKTSHGAGDAERFLREARVLADLDHEAVVGYVTHGADAGGEPYLAMEWLDGEDLGARLAREPLDVGEALALGARVADALAHAHGRGVVHRDLKPGNLILVGGDAGAVKVVDFGVARPLLASRAMTATGAVLGTIGYMAPEQAMGHSARVDARADLFALGCVLFESLAGRPAFGGDHVLAVLAKLLHGDVPRLSDARPGLDPWIDALVAGLLERDPDARLGDAAAVARELREGAAAATSAPAPRLARASLGAEEQAVAWVLLVEFSAGFDAETVRFDAPDAPLGDIVARFGAELSVIGGGALLVTVRAGAQAVNRAVRAARCALALRVALPEARIALATARAPSRGLLGPVIDRAAAVLAAASAPGVAVDEATAAMLDDRFAFSVGPAGARLEREREAAGARRLLGRAAPFAGRDRELRVLCDLVAEAAEEGVARVALVTGPAGSGKSRLLHELLHAQPVECVWLARADALSGRAPQALVAELFRRATGVRAGDSAASARAAVVARLGEAPVDTAADFVVEALGLTEAPSDAVVAARAEPAVMEARVRDALKALCDAACARGPMLLAIEDLHWSDPGSVRALDHVLGELRDRPLVVVATARPEVRASYPEVWAARGALRVDLPRLSPRAAARIVREALGAEASPARVDALVDRGAGNPLLLEELVRAAARGLAELPDTLQAIVQGRLEEEPPAVRRLLRAASVVGETFWAGAVAALVGEPEADALAALLPLLDREWIVTRDAGRFSGTQELAFRHALVRDAAYAMLTREDRELGHALAARWLEGVGEKDPRFIAEHLERAGRPADAVPLFLAAARLALRGNDLAAVLECAARGVACGASGETLGELRLAEGEALAWRGEVAAGLDAIVAATALLPIGGAAWSDAIGWRAMAGGQLHDPTLALETIDLLAATRPAPGASAEYARATAYVMTISYFAGERAAPERLLASAASGVDTHDARALGWLEFARLEAERFGSGDAWKERAFGLASAAAFARAGDALGVAHATTQLALSEWKLGAWDDATTHADEAAATTTRLGLRLLSTHALALGALLEARAGAATARARIDAALGVCRALDDELYGAYATLLCAMALRALGEAAAAESLIRDVLGVVRLWGLRVTALGELAAALLDQGRAAEAALVCRELDEISRPVRLFGVTDLEIRATAVRALDGVGMTELAAKLARQSAELVERRAASIDEARYRAGFLATPPCVQLLRRATA